MIKRQLKGTIMTNTKIESVTNVLTEIAVRAVALLALACIIERYSNYL